MKTRLLRGFAAVAVAMAMMFGVAGAPARAADTGDYTDAVVDILGSLLGKLEDGSLSPSEVIALVQELRGAINSVKVDVVARLDAQAVADLKAATEASIAKLDFLNNRITALTLANDAINAAYKAKAYVDVVSSDHDVDAVGRSMMTLYTISEVAREKVGLTAEGRRQLLADYRAGLQKLIDKMAPHCEESALPNAGFFFYRCTYDGKTVRGELGPDGFRVDGGPPQPGGLDRQLIEDLTMADTAEKLAKDALEILRQRGY